MRIVELTNTQFDEFAKFHPLSNYCQSSKYALIMSEYGYSYDYIGLIDETNAIKAAALILTKKLAGRIKYGYSPKGFLINFYDKNLTNEFLNKIKEYYQNKDFIFIKFNPEIIIGDTDKRRNYSINYNGNVRIIDDLKESNVKRRMELKEFDLMLPKFNSYIDLKNFDISHLNRNYRKKIKKSINSGMSINISTSKEIDKFYSLVKEKTRKPISFYRNMLNVFSKDNSAELLFVKIDFQKYLTELKRQYDIELEKNDKYNTEIQQTPKRKKLNRKMDSDKKIEYLKDQIIRATQSLKKHPEETVAGAVIVKHYNRISIIDSGYKKEYSYLNPNHFLYYSIFERYKQFFNFCDIGGVSGNFEKNSEYYGLNKFKLDFNPTIYEFIGEFDLICNDHLFKKMIKTNFVEEEFKK